MMQIVLPKDDLLKEKSSFYTGEEQHLLEQLESGKLETKPHHEVMENLKKVLNLDEI
ncbi:hypothetical protein [Rodentibacter heidelbergensis]|uniref:hypothetical protein n=1 Tax=Rodentibacter heidelbergensis TaxID=1908258 RepID=UPI00130166CE|nr:hypothetical protein [Rodentibacter heidelbergensis]